MLLGFLRPLVGSTFFPPFFSVDPFTAALCRLALAGAGRCPESHVPRFLSWWVNASEWRRSAFVSALPVFMWALLGQDGPSVGGPGLGLGLLCVNVLLPSPFCAGTGLLTAGRVGVGVPICCRPPPVVHPELHWPRPALRHGVVG